MEKLAQSQDTIGWRKTLEGRVPNLFYAIQHTYLATRQTLKLTGEDWMKGFITHLIHISHSQWLFWNFTLQDQLHGYRNLKERAEVALRIKVLSQTDLDRIPKLAWSDFDTQSYWVVAMEAACGASMVALTGKLSRPKLSKFETFKVLESIRQEMGDIFHTGNSTMTRLQSPEAAVHNIHNGSEPHLPKAPQHPRHS